MIYIDDLIRNWITFVFQYELSTEWLWHTELDRIFRDNFQFPVPNHLIINNYNRYPLKDMTIIDHFLKCEIPKVIIGALKLLAVTDMDNVFVDIETSTDVRIQIQVSNNVWSFTGCIIRVVVVFIVKNLLNL